ncbi:MAG: ABC transporter ATP-binding protein [Armatimonadota bacterium]
MDNREAVHADGLTKLFSRSGRASSGDKGTRRRKKRREVRALDSVDLSIPSGEIFGIVGPNGCGKSTLVRVLATLLIPDEGAATVFGHDVVAEERTVQRLINRVSVEAAFFKKLSALENLRYAARLYSLDPTDAAEKARAILKRLGFPVGRINESMQDLSRGMQQKVGIARGLLTRPIVMLLDEPTTGLDPKSKRDVQAFIRGITEGHDATVLLSTHDMEEADTLCDRVAIMRSGKVIALGTPAELKQMCSSNGEVSLEDVFIELTGRKLEDEDDEE